MENKVMMADQVGFVELLETFGSDLTVANAARVSFNKESALEPVLDGEGGGTVGYRLADRDQKLIAFLAEHNHNTPFFHPMLRFRIKMPIFVAREWFRSTIGFARNEVSRRYVSYEPEFAVPLTLRKRDKNIKQGSSAEAVERNEELIAEMREFMKQSVDLYNRLMQQDNVCPEQARMVLPQAMYTEFIETASLAAYGRIVGLRADPTAQREIQEYARGVAQLIKPAFPASWQALVKLESA